jgi:hypothetical protein
VQTFIKVAVDTGESLPDEVMPPKMPKHILEVIDFFDTVATQWNVGFAGMIGLNYQSVTSMASVYSFELTPYRMDVLREIEYYYLERNKSKDG